MMTEPLRVLAGGTGPFLVNHVWQSTLFAAAAWLITLALRKNRASVRCWLWVAASAKFLLPFSLLIGLGSLLPLSHRISVGREATVYSAIDLVGSPFHKAASLGSQVPAPIQTTSLVAWLLVLLEVAWLTGTLMVLMIWLRRWRQIGRSLRFASILETEREIEVLRGLESALAIRKPIPLQLSRELMEPGIFGIVRPRLLWPEGLSERLCDEEIASVLAHELVHVMRRDNLTAAMHMVVQALFWFHPLVWWMERRMVEERERACDEAVVELGSRPEVYAESLLKTCRFCLESPLVCMAGVTGANLSKRVVLIMRQQMTPKLDRSRKLLLTAAGLMSVALPIAFGLERAAQVPAQKVGEPDWQAKAGGKMAFEVASIHLSKPDAFFPPTFALSPDDSYAENPGHFRAVFPLTTYFEFAYKWMPTSEQSEALLAPLPKWVSTDYYVIEARAPGKPTKDQMRLMMQSLLADRFHLAMHYETRPSSVYALVLNKPGVTGPSLRPHSEGPRCVDNVDLSDPKAVAALGGVFPPICQAFMERPVKDGQVLLGSRNTTMALLASSLTSVQDLGRPVVDETGLAGNFDFTIQWTPDPSSIIPHEKSAEEGPGSTFSEALKEQLGLKLKPAKAPIEVPVIDHVERPAEN